MNIIMYCTPYCPYCVRAKQLLNTKAVPYEVIDVDMDFNKRQEMEQKSGRTSVPQIFINELHVGGFDDLSALNIEGKLDQLLQDN